jgi:hypothetical protein
MFTYTDTRSVHQHGYRHTPRHGPIRGKRDLTIEAKETYYYIRGYRHTQVMDLDMYTYAHAWESKMHICTFFHNNLYTYSCAYIYPHVFIYACHCTCAVHAHARTRTRMFMYSYTQTYAHIHALTHELIHEHTHTHAHAHAQTPTHTKQTLFSSCNYY